MTTEELFIKEGAFYTAANQLAYRHTIVGDVGEAGLVLNDAGKKIHAELAGITDVEVKPVRRRKGEVDDTTADEKAIDALLAE